MKTLNRRCLAALILVAAAQSALALDYRSIAESAVMYDAPSAKAQPLFVIARNTPVEIVVALDNWIKVRDVGGTLAWVERRLLAEQRTVMIKVTRAQIRAQADDAAQLVFEADKDVLLDVVETTPPGWAKVKHRDGQAGYVRAMQVWGL